MGRNRQTLTYIELVDNRDGHLEDLNTGLRWFLICTDHSGCIGFETKKRARLYASRPLDWCPGCQAFDRNCR